MPEKLAQKRIHQLWDELHAIPPSDSDHALLHLLEAMAGMIGADQAYWAATLCFSQREDQPDHGLHGWRTRVVRSLHPYSRAQIALLQDIRRRSANGTLDPGDTTRALVADAGSHRTHRLHDGLVDFGIFRQTQHYGSFYEAFGIVDRLWSVFPISQNAEAYFFFDLINTERRFTQ